MKNNEIIYHGEILWDYHKMSKKLAKSDFILAMGSHDIRTAEHAAHLFLSGYSNIIVVSGGYGKVTKEIWSMTEAEKFKEIIVNAGVPEKAVITEKNATNTGDNFVFTKRILIKNKIEVTDGIVVTKPYMCRRAYATGAKQWPEINWQVSSPEISFLNYPNKEVSFERMINLMVGDLQRIAVYPEKGFQIEQQIPSNVWKSYYFLVSQGFDKFIIK